MAAKSVQKDDIVSVIFVKIKNILRINYIKNLEDISMKNIKGFFTKGVSKIKNCYGAFCRCVRNFGSCKTNFCG
jgi:hypothetical protein